MLKTIKNLFSCKLCWLITLTIFLVFLFIESLILIPTYRAYHQQQIDNLNLSTLSTIKALLTVHKDEWENLNRDGNKIIQDTTLRGAAVYSTTGQLLIKFGVDPKTSLDELQKIPANNGVYYREKNQYVTLFDSNELQLPYKVIAVVNAANLDNLLRAFIISYLDEFLLTAFLLTFFMMLVVGLFILSPIIQARRQLLLAVRHAAEPGQHLIQYTPNNELGEVFKITNTFLLKISGYLDKLKQQQSKLSLLNRSLDSKVKQRTGELAQRNEELEIEIMQRKNAEKELTNMALFPHQNNNPVLRINNNGQIIYANPASESLLRFWNVKVGDALPDILQRIVFDALFLNVTKTTELACDDKYYLLNFVPISTHHYVNLYGADITQRKQYEEQLQFLNGHDTLTGLTNRGLFENLLSQVISETTDESNIAVILLAINNFNELNQALGHILGDALLKYVGDKLTQQFPQAMVAYLGTNIFALGIHKLNSPTDADIYAANTMELFKPRFLIGKHQLHITINLGIAIYPLDANHPSDLIKNADLALFHARSKGQNRIQFFTDSLNKHLEIRHRLFQDLHVALAQREFFLCYQPQLDITDNNKIVGAEALLRWQHPTLGLINPNDFISLLESSHLIDPVTEWILDTVAKQHLDWQKQGLPAMRIGINFSGDQLQNDNIITLFKNILIKYPIKPEYLELEITERMAIADPKKSLALLTTLHHLGIKISIDDFGTDYSSLRYLHELPVDKIKIDKSFLDAAHHSSNDNVVLCALINLAHNLQLQVIAEGVETESQLHYLKSLGCDEVQGYFIAKPMRENDFVEFYLRSVATV